MSNGRGTPGNEEPDANETELAVSAVPVESIGPYQLIRKLGEGGMGEVWEARDTRLARSVAIKRLKLHSLKRFGREAQAIAALNHAHICQIYDVGPDYLVLEYIDGKPLHGPLPVREALALAIGIAGAVEAAHAEGILHRDLKPANVLVTASGAKLLDFGLAKAVAPSDSDSTNTMAGTILGTAAYMSPEQAEGKPLDVRSDIFSFGALLYFMLSGEPPFTGGSTAELLAAVIRDEAAPLNAPEPVSRIVMRCLRKAPAERFQRMADVKAELERLLPGQIPEQRRIAPRLGQWRLVGLGLIVVAASIALFFWLAMRGSFTKAPVEIQQLTGAPIPTRLGSNLHPALSPDGSRVAYVVGQESGHLYIQNLGDFTPQRIGSEGAVSVAWAPDSERIAYLRATSSSAAEVHVFDLQTKADRVILPKARFQYDFPRGNLLTWTSDGDSLIITNTDNANRAAGLILVSLRDGNTRRLTLPKDPQARDISPRLSPDGRTLAFIRQTSTTVLGICTVPFPSAMSEPSCPKSDLPLVFGLTFGPDSQTLIASLGKVGLAGHLWRIPLRSAEPRSLIAMAEEDAFEPTYAAGKLAYTTGTIRVMLQSYAISAGRAMNEQTFAPLSRIEIFPRFSPDGKQVAFVCNQTGAYDVWLISTSGTSDPHRLCALNGEDVEHIYWSKDGQLLTFSERIDSKYATYVVSAAGGAPRKLALSSDGTYLTVGFGQDLNSIYLAQTVNHSVNLVRFDLISNREQLLATESPGAQLEMASGEESYWAGRPGGALYEVDLRTKAKRLSISGAWDDFSPDALGVLLMDATKTGEGHCLSRYSYRTKRVTPLGACACTGPGLTMSPDESRVICTDAQPSTEIHYATLN